MAHAQALRLRCFVAMAIGRPDTDALYSRRIRPTLRAIGVHPVRIDELHHGENIDQRILREIERSEFVVADLTYERPSVYFEAGWAERKGIPVIYTCRADHLDPPSRDAPRVHFDVPQRQIVVWTPSRDDAFPERLAARVRARTAPLRRTKQREHERQLEEACFQTLPLDGRRDRLMQVAVRAARAAGFRDAPDQLPVGGPPGWIGHRRRAGRVEVLCLLPVAAYHRRQLIALREAFGMDTFGLGGLAVAARGLPGRQCVVVASLSAVPASRVEGVFREFAPDPTMPRAWTGQTGGIRSHLIVLDALRSEPQFRESFTALLQQLGR